MARKKTNFQKLKGRSTSEKNQYRDVYEDQQLERSQIADKQSFTSRLILCIFLSLFIAAAVYFLVSFVVYGLDAIKVISGKATVGGLSGTDALRAIPISRYISPGFANMVAAGLSFIAFMGLFVQIFKRNLKAQNLMNDTTDINQYQNDQHIMLPEEMHEMFDFAPNVGGHFPAEVSSMLSHMMLSNKGVKKIKFAKRYDKDVIGEDGEVEYYKGEAMMDDDDEIIFETVPFFDEKFGEALYDASGMPKDKLMRKYFDSTNIIYNPGNENRDKTKDADTLCDLINNTWTFPEYEPQRPSGAYVVDTAPVNTMILAMTRAGKGQTYIEPVIDLWTREQSPHNMVINDPKGELLVKNYVRGTVRGFQIVQFNLINAMKTDIYNPLGLAAEAAREGNFKECAMYVNNIGDVFFPVAGGDDPVWPNAANNAFKRAAYGLIDYYLEEENALKAFAERTGMDETTLETKLDVMWGKVTLFNTYQMFVQLTAKKMKNPGTELNERMKNKEFAPGPDGPDGDGLDDDAYFAKWGRPRWDDDEFLAYKAGVEAKMPLWEDKPESDLSALYFSATRKLPRNGMRALVNDADASLKSMAGAEKMMASVYGIAITAMAFFTDPTISTLTSGTPSQNTDLGGLSFPRRFGVRFNLDYMNQYHIMGMQARWMSYEDAGFTKPLGKDFAHDDTVSREGWARYYFKGKYPKNLAYIKLEIINPQTNMLIRQFFFEFKKSFQMSLDARYYITDPVLDEKIVKNGILTELSPKKQPDGTVKYVKGKTYFNQEKIADVLGGGGLTEVKTPAITRTLAKYSEKPRMVFLVTPPHLMKYAQLILILIKQLVDLNFDKSYMTKSSQKPLYKTRYMLDELGNLQSDGHGIANFETMLSIGLGQEQQFTLILQTLQQLKDVYGDSVDKVVQGNVANIIFLKSTDDSMLDTLQKMSGTTHRSFTDSKSITKDVEKLMLQTEGKVTYTMTTKEVPVISYNDMAFLPERNSIVFRAGNSPIWNRNETILPMSFRLFMNAITQPGKDYSLQTIPTLSSAMDFDVRKNMPDFARMVDMRMNQAAVVDSCIKRYKEVYGYDDFAIEQLDPDIYSGEILDMVNTHLRAMQNAEREAAGDSDEYDADDYGEFEDSGLSAEEIFELQFDRDEFMADVEDNTEVTEIVAERERMKASMEGVKYAKGLITKADIIGMDGVTPIRTLDKELLKAYHEVKGDMWADSRFFSNRHGSLYSSDGSVEYISQNDMSEDLRRINEASEDEESRVYAEGEVTAEEISSFGSYTITDEFYRFLAGLNKWSFANGRFDDELARILGSDDI